VTSEEIKIYMTVRGSIGPLSLTAIVTVIEGYRATVTWSENRLATKMKAIPPPNIRGA